MELERNLREKEFLLITNKKDKTQKQNKNKQKTKNKKQNKKQKTKNKKQKTKNKKQKTKTKKKTNNTSKCVQLKEKKFSGIVPSKPLLFG